ncbi:MAG: putative toxin-antitoxin system toxin component, PIN family [Ferruginibacter sp.]
MQRIVIDTNVVVTALIQRGYPHLILENVLLKSQFQICILEELLLEYDKVLARPKFTKFPDFFLRAEALIAEIGARAVTYFSTIKLNLISDNDDNMIFELADECAADFIITGNMNDFTFTNYKTTKIVSPKEFWDVYPSNS